MTEREKILVNALKFYASVACIAYQKRRGGVILKDNGDRARQALRAVGIEPRPVVPGSGGSPP